MEDILIGLEKDSLVPIKKDEQGIDTIDKTPVPQINKTTGQKKVPEIKLMQAPTVKGVSDVLPMFSEMGAYLEKRLGCRSDGSG